jgi:hypothetical protein
MATNPNLASQSTKSLTEELLRRGRRAARRRVRRLLNGGNAGGPSGAARPAAAPAPRVVPRPNGAPLAHDVALRENGFTVYRNLFSADECRELAAQLKAEAGIRESVKHMKVDATNAYPTARELVLEGRILDAVRTAIGDDARFLQVSDLHYRHDTFNWHRDSVHRAHDASAAADWRAGDTSFGVVKAILYLEAENAAMGIMAGSHASPFEMDREFVKQVEDEGGQIVIGAQDNPNQRFTASEKRIPMAWKAEVGDVLVFDERMYHAGRRVDAGKVSTNNAAPKFTLSLVFGADNHHSERMYSYFRYAREELSYRDLPASFVEQLEDHGLVLSSGWRNFYTEQPQELRHVYLPDPAKLEPLIAKFSRTAS